MFLALKHKRSPNSEEKMSVYVKLKREFNREKA